MNWKYIFIASTSILLDMVNGQGLSDGMALVLKKGGKCFKKNRLSTQPLTLPATKYTVPAFKGKQTGIGSWFVSNSKSDSTNGNSWCGYPYKDYSNGFAPDLSQMQPKGVSYEDAAKMYCGLQAIVTDPTTGVTKTMYIIDAFDPKWVRSPGSIDIMKNAWSELHKQNAYDKNIVIKDVEWYLTGEKSSQYCFKCQGDR